MIQTFDVTEIEVGFHPEGYRIDKTASPMNRYTKWQVSKENRWSDPGPVCFDSMPENGWIKADGFDWQKENTTKEQV